MQLKVFLPILLAAKMSKLGFSARPSAWHPGTLSVYLLLAESVLVAVATFPQVLFPRESSVLTPA